MNRKGVLMLALLAFVLAVPLYGQASAGLLCDNCAAASSVTTDDTDVALVCWYIGTSGSGYVTVAADGNLLFESPDSSTASTHIECDASIAADGARNGTIDVSVAACNTVTEVLNIVNKPESDFRCAPYAIVGTDDLDISGTGWLLAASDESCNPPNGCKIESDTDTALKISQVVQRPTVWTLAGKHGDSRAGARGNVVSNPYHGQIPYLSGAEVVSTYGSGTSTVNVYSIKPQFTPAYDPATSNVGFTYSETVSTLWTATAGATTVTKVFGSCDTPATGCDVAWGPLGLFGGRDEKMLVRLTNSDALATATVKVNGLTKTE